MPIAGFSKLARFSDACGAELPRWMRKKFEGFGDDAESIRAFGLDVVTELCEKLLAGGAPGLHFYCMNQAALTTEICKPFRYARKDGRTETMNYWTVPEEAMETPNGMRPWAQHALAAAVRARKPKKAKA
jgi:hypothetical protein